MKKLLLACSLVGFCLPAFAETDFCAQVPVNAPEIPQLVNTADELMSVRQNVLNYIEDAEKRLICQTNTKSYNSLVDEMHIAADQYNQLLATYKSASL